MVSLAWLVSAQQSPVPAAPALLDRYAAGHFDAVAADVAALTDFQQIVDDLDGRAEAWLAGGGPADRPRRELAAATFALEAARAAEWREWKWIQRSPQGPLPTLYWKPAPLLIEWGCELLRRRPAPDETERLWQLAAMAVAQRSEDPQFLIGRLQIVPDLTETAPAPAGRGRSFEVVNSKKEIAHLAHSRARFPGEPRFLLGEGVARERWYPDEAVLAYGQVVNHPDIGGEAEMRLGALHLRQNRLPNALSSFDRAERATRDTYVIYLSRFFRGQILLRQQRASAAEEAFRGAVAARPGAQSASVLLAEILFKDGRRAEAQQVMAAFLTAAPGGGDPALDYAHADDRFWPELLARLRREIRP
jgi:tetratricopeptide (TPR) repeat protein